MFSLLSDNWLICFFHFVIKNDLNKMLTLFLNFPSGFFRRRLISVFVVLRMFTMILIDSYHVGILERYNSLVSLYASFNSGNSFPRFSKRYQYNNMSLIMLKYNGNLPSSDNTAMLVVLLCTPRIILVNPRETKSGRGSRVCHPPPPPPENCFSERRKMVHSVAFWI